MEQNENNRIVIIDGEGKERQCEILFTYNHEETGKNYVVFYPVDEDDSEENMDLFAYSYIEKEGGVGDLYPLESDEEYDLINDVVDSFYEDQLASESENNN